MTAPGTMTLAELQKLIADSKGEWEQIEFKKTTGELHGGMETLCGFLNGAGGKVLFGVTNSGKVVGQDASDATFQEIANAIRKLEPPAWIEQIRVPVGEAREVLILQTTVHADAPYTFDGRPYVRIGNTTSRMPQAEYQRRLLARMAAPFRWEDIPAGRFKPADLDTGEIERMLDAAVACGRLERRPESIPEALDKLKLRVDGQLTSAAAVLFAKDPFPSYPQCGIRMARFRGTSKLNDFIDQRQVTGHAFRLLEEAELFLNRHIAIAGTFRPDRWERQDRPEYPPLALREALVNALCHRDYSIVGGAIYVAIFDDRLEIISMGTLPPGITVDQLKQPHTSVQRNPAIADVFFRRGLIEKWGRGTQRIVEMCLAGGYPEPEFLEESGVVTVRFPLGTYAPPTQVKHDLTDRQREILLLLGEGGKWQTQEIVRRLAKSAGVRAVQIDLGLLRQYGLVQTHGRGGNARWWLATESS